MGFSETLTKHAHVGRIAIGGGMGIAAETMTIVRSGLCDRIDRLAHDLPHMSMGQLCTGIDDIRRTALTYGLDPVVQLARGLETALADSNGTGVVLPWLDTMRDAAGCERIDAEASSAWLASINIRMAV